MSNLVAEFMTTNCLQWRVEWLKAPTRLEVLCLKMKMMKKIRISKVSSRPSLEEMTKMAEAEGRINGNMKMNKEIKTRIK